MIEVPSANNQIVCVGRFELFSGAELFDHFVQPELLKYWWPEQAVTDPQVGGKYNFTWPDMNWELHGEYTAFEPAKHLGFTWNWSHEPQFQPLQVDIYFSDIVEGCRLGLFHGPFIEQDAAQRQGVVEGWIHFGMRLAGLRRVEE